MRRLLGVLLVLGVLLLCVGFLRALTLRSRQVQVAQAPHYAIADEPAALERLAAAIRIQTISHQDPAADDPATFRAFREHLERSFPRMHQSLAREVVNGGSLLYRWNGRDPERPAVLLMAHQDVVPVEPGTEKQWTAPPFSGAIQEGFVWGRGTLDVKGRLLALCEAVERLLAEGYTPPRNVYFAFGHDEEVGGRRGAAQIASLLAARRERLSWVLDEGGAIAEGVVPGVDRPVALVGVAEKGYLSLALTAKAEGGHSSMPRKHSAIGILASAIERLEQRPFPARMCGVMRAFVDALAPEMRWSMRVLAANVDVAAPLVVRMLAATPRGNAAVRTTTAVTMISGGVKENALPSSARAIVNFRLLPGDTIARVIASVRRIVADKRVSVGKNPGSNANEPSPESRADSPNFAFLARTIRASYPDVVVAPNLVLGGTDSRHYGLIAEDVYRFGPNHFRSEDFARMHGLNERISVQDYVNSIGFYMRLIRDAK